MIARTFLVIALLAASTAAAVAQTRVDVTAAPALRASVTVTGDLVRIGDIIDNAGSAAQIAIYRAPDLGTTGSLPVAQVLNALRSHQVIGVDTRDLKEISVTRLARTFEGKDIEQQIARTLERKNGLGDAANLNLTFDRDPGDVRLDASNTGGMQATIVRFDPRSGRFDITFEISNDSGTAPTKLRFTGSAVETIEAAVLVRNLERNEVLKSSDVVVERRPKAEVGSDAATRDRAVGMQARRQLRAGQAVRVADLAKPDLAARPERHADLRHPGALSHRARQGARERHRRRRRQRHEPAIQAHGVRHRHRPRPGIDHGRNAAPLADIRCRLFAKCHLFAERSPVRCARLRRQCQFSNRSKSRVM